MKNGRFERYSTLVFSLIQIGLLAAVCAAAVASLNKNQQVRWMDAACSSTLQIYAGVNQTYRHRSAGGNYVEFLQSLIFIALLNAISALAQFCGTIIIYCLALKGRGITRKTYYGIVLMQLHHSSGTDTDTGGAVRLESMRTAGSIQESI
ncbi:hypothetical protein DM02DRAFT_633974 [Periconia macrospinosa]|uniref:Uncharacterized protein n=1 Tax=Periconia macrospinosa TaxID=97972 RepID=A0A2V1D7M8_9PLEO|nr:hypothetical protein DM02DRAFT_633974 [Periconia macrospinosa]